MCVLVFCVCSSYCVSKSVCARVFAFMSVYEGLYVFEWVPARLVKTDSLVVSFVFSLYWCLCPWQKSARTHTCLWRGCWRTLLGMCLFFSMLSLCEFACVYVHRCMWHICLLSLCLCECVHTCVCGAHAGDIPPQMRETRVPMLEAPLPLFLYCLPATCATCNSPNTNTNTNIYIIHICKNINTHTNAN